MDFAVLSGAAKNQLCGSLRAGTARRLQVLLTQVFCYLAGGSVYAKVWVNQQDDNHVLQSALNDATKDIGAEALEQVKELPALKVASTGPLSAEPCGGGEKAVCHGASAQIVTPTLVLPDAAPAGSMPSSVEAATIIGSVRAALGKQEVVALQSILTEHFAGIIAASLSLGLFALVYLLIWARHDRNRVAVEQGDDQFQE